MTASERGLLGQMDDYTLDGKFHEATEAFCRLAGFDLTVVTGVREAECMALRRRWGKDQVWPSPG